MVAGQFPWSILIVVNLRQPHSPPWAVPIMALYLTLYWRYLNGWGWPTRSAQMRRDSFRARGLPGNVWLRAMASGMLAVAAAVMLQNAYGRLVPIPAAIAPDFSPYPWYTVLLPLLMGGTVSGVAEEAGFRGYMQSAIEREHGPVVAIAVVSLAFAAIHFTHGVSSTLPRLPYYLAIFGHLWNAHISHGFDPADSGDSRWRKRIGIPDRLALGNTAFRASYLAERSGCSILARFRSGPCTWHGGRLGLQESEASQVLHSGPAS